MLPLHTILHPTDLSEHSATAFRLACALARDYGARLVLLHVVSPSPALSAPGLSKAEDQHRELLEKLHGLDVLDPRIGVERRLKDGDPVTEILVAAQETQAD